MQLNVEMSRFIAALKKAEVSAFEGGFGFGEGQRVIRLRLLKIIYFDQASLLVQLGVLDPGKLPVAGVATARKVLDDELPSNELMKRILRDEDL